MRIIAFLAVLSLLIGGYVRTYYKKHLDPADMPEASDIVALEAIHLAQGIFDERLKTSFSNPIAEIQNLGYPGINDPRITLSTRIKPLDGLNHSSALQYDVIAPSGEKAEVSVRLPEQYNGLGYAIGYFLFETVGHAILEFYDLAEEFSKVKASFHDNSALIVLIASWTPIPYKVITIASGVAQINLTVFFLASLLGRGLRFLAVAALLWKYGGAIDAFISKHPALLATVFFILLISGFVALKYLL